MIYGIDASKWQGEMDWKKTKSAGAQFAFIRAGSISVGGELYEDYQFQRNAQIAPDYLPVGFYWYYRPQHDPIKQADYFCSLIRDKRYKLPPVMDLEETGDLLPGTVSFSAANFATQTKRNLGVWPLLYSRGQWLNDHTDFSLILSSLDLWIARYKAGLTGPWSDEKYKPRDFDDWRFWQVSADGNGRGPEFGAGSPHIPIDFFNGDQADFDLYCNTLTSHLIKIKGLLAVSLRADPGGSAIGATWRGSIWPFISRSIDREYYKVEAWIKASDVEEI